jgi:hypothetical protein
MTLEEEIDSDREILFGEEAKWRSHIHEPGRIPAAPFQRHLGDQENMGASEAFSKCPGNLMCGAKQNGR